MPRLILKNRVLADVPLPVRGDLALIGRGPEAQVRIDHPSVSRIHARLESAGGAWTLHDLDSRNGTWVNDDRAVGATTLATGDRLRFGETEAIFEDVDAAEAQAPRHRRAAAAAVAFGPTERRVETTPAFATTTVSATVGGAAGSRADGSRKPGARLVVVVLLAVAAVGVAAYAALRTPAPVAPPTPARYRDALDDPAFVAAADAEAAAARAAAGSGAKPPAETESAPPTEGAAPAPTPAEAPGETEADSRPASSEPERRGAHHEPAMAPADDAAMGGGEDVMGGAPAEPPAEPPASPPPSPSLSPPPPVVGDAEPTPAPATTSDPSRPRRVPTLDERFRYRRLAYDLLGRPPTEDELAEYAAAGREATVDRLLGSRERWEAWYEDELYDLLLIDEFRPGADRLDDLPGRLADGRTHVRDALAEIAKSQQFNARNPGNDTYVTVVFEQFLGITVQSEKALLEEGKRMYDGRAATIFGKRGRSQADFVDIALAEPRFAATYVARRATALLAGAPPRADLERWTRAVREDPARFPAVEREILLSDAWTKGLAAARKKSDRRFVTGLWHDLLRRAPTYQELRNLRNASQALTDPAGLRSLVIGAILNSAAAAAPKKDGTDPAAWIPELFERLLARRPTQNELTTFLSAWKNPACRPTTVLHALLTSAEYDRY